MRKADLTPYRERFAPECQAAITSAFETATQMRHLQLTPVHLMHGLVRSSAENFEGLLEGLGSSLSALLAAIDEFYTAAPVQADHPEIKHWVVGGHSLGGVAASVYAKDRLQELDGVVFFASYPADESLKNSDIKILSIYGTLDMAGMGKFDETKALLPPQTEYVVMDGGNHAQFGSYGFQAGDNTATISPEDQWAQISTATVEFLKTISQ